MGNFLAVRSVVVMGTPDSGEWVRAGAGAQPIHQWALSGPGHAVQFYQDDAHLRRVVTNFVLEGLSANQPVVLIATREHGAMVEADLQRHGIAIDDLKISGELVILDAREVLGAFLVDRALDPELFRRIVGGMLERAGGRRRVVRAYGEMVDVLWKANNPKAALQLEQLWNDLASSYHFALLCGYAIGNFMSPVHVAAFEDICGVHHHVVSADRQTTAR